MAMILRNASLFSFRTTRFVLCLDIWSVDLTPWLYGNLRFSRVCWKKIECRALAEERESLFVGGQAFAVVEYILYKGEIGSAQT